MDVYVLDSLFRRTRLIDDFESMIWTERYSAFGDFELVVYSTPTTRSLLTVTTRLVINDSYRVMTIETVEDKSDTEGRLLLTVKGRSLEALLEDRIARDSLASLATQPKYYVMGTPAGIVRSIVALSCTSGSLDLADKIPYLTMGNTIFPADTIAESSEVLTIEVELQTVYNAVKTRSDMYDLGFRLVRNLETSQLQFSVYTGCDRTSSQIALPAVIFSPELDNLSGPAELTSVEGFMNVCYVFSSLATEVVYAPGVDETVAGFDRHVMFLKIEDNTDVPLTSEYLVQQGIEALANARSVSVLDGEISQSSAYKYGRDYNLGDLIELRNADGITNKMRVTEQIFVSDEQGERSYPTLTVNTAITPGSWFAWSRNQVWDDAPGFWEDA